MRKNERKISSNPAPAAGLSLPSFAWALAGSLFFVLETVAGELNRGDNIADAAEKLLDDVSRNPLPA
jgi:hypothetical protein